MDIEKTKEEEIIKNTHLGIHSYLLEAFNSGIILYPPHIIILHLDFNPDKETVLLVLESILNMEEYKLDRVKIVNLINYYKVDVNVIFNRMKNCHNLENMAKFLYSLNIRQSVAIERGVLPNGEPFITHYHMPIVEFDPFKRYIILIIF